MKRIFFRSGAAWTLLMASTATLAQSPDTTAWLNESVARATSDTAGWHVSKPVVQLADENYFMVAPNGTVLAGRRFLEKLSAEKDRDDLLRFVLIHEFRHIHQLQRKETQSRAALECDADFHAAIRLSSSTLQLAADPDAAVGRVIAFQSIGPRLNRMADTAGHGHLTSDQRFLAGAFGGWRAIYQWLASKGKLEEPRYAELAKRAKSFAEPASVDDSTWAAKFCDALITGAKSERKSIDFRGKGTETIQEGARVFFKDSWELGNTTQWPLQITGWQVIGIRNKDNEDDYASYMAGQANAIDMLLQPGETKSVTFLQMYPRTSSSMTFFNWSQPYTPQTVLTTVRAGPRAEPPNCQASWKPPADKSVADLFDFLLKAGNSARRQFVGVRGEQRTDLGLSTTIFYDVAALPSRANRDQSFIAMRKNGSDPSASITLLETETPAEAERLFDEIANAFEASCGAKVVQRGRDKDGDLRLRIDRLTPLSSATLYVMKREARSNGKQRYSVTWLVNPLDE